RKTRCRQCASRLRMDQLQQRKQIDPNNVDEVPVQAGIFKRRVLLGRVRAPPRSPGEKREETDANNNAQGVHAGHREIERKIHLRVLLVDGSIGMTGSVTFEMEAGLSGDVV